MAEPPPLPPLISFSLYSHIQSALLTKRADYLMVDLDLSFSPQGVDGQLFDKIYGEFWLWILGAYECTRTMCQHKHCFSPAAAERLLAFKKSICRIRVPFAKQELQGKNGVYVRHELSVSDVDSNRRDFAFDVSGKQVWMRTVLQDFLYLVASISAEDVVHRLGTQRP